MYIQISALVQTNDTGCTYSCKCTFSQLPDSGISKRVRATLEANGFERWEIPQEGIKLLAASRPIMDFEAIGVKI